jgi:hypothetical protein
VKEGRGRVAGGHGTMISSFQPYEVHVTLHQYRYWPLEIGRIDEQTSINCKYHRGSRRFGEGRGYAHAAG